MLRAITIDTLRMHTHSIYAINQSLHEMTRFITMEACRESLPFDCMLLDIDCFEHSNFGTSVSGDVVREAVSCDTVLSVHTTEDWDTYKHPVECREGNWSPRGAIDPKGSILSTYSVSIFTCTVHSIKFMFLSQNTCLSLLYVCRNIQWTLAYPTTSVPHKCVR